VKVEIILDKIYKRKKDGSLSNFAKKFMAKNNFIEKQDYTIDELSMAVVEISNKEKRKEITKFLITERNNETVIQTKEVFKVGDLRKKTYHETVKALHPDNQETGDRDSFDLIQLIGYHLWNYKGEPRKEVKRISDRKECWAIEKERAETGKIDLFKNMKKQNENTEEDEGFPF